MVNVAVAKREEYVLAGLLRKDITDDKTLAVYTYTDKCVYDRIWDEITIHSRGHIYNIDSGERAACSFGKFWNLSENAQVAPESFDWTKNYDVYTKADGWLGILYRHQGKYKVASRGSFRSAGAVWATKFIQDYDLSCLPDDVTLVFEMISPELKIILDYGGMRTLLVLAAFNRHTGEEYSRSIVERWAAQIGLPLVEKHTHTIEDCLKEQQTGKNSEGYVIHFQDGRRVKVKNEWYRALAKLLAHLSPISVWEVLSSGKVKLEYSHQFPHEIRPIVDRYARILEEQYVMLYNKIEIECSAFIAEVGKEPKQVGLNKDKLTGIARRAVFVWLKKDQEGLNKVIMNAIYPAANEFIVIA